LPPTRETALLNYSVNCFLSDQREISILLFYFENLFMLGNSEIFGTGFSLKSRALLKSLIPL